jgi:hypothetical protein
VLFDQSLADDIGQQQHSHVERIRPADHTTMIRRELYILESGSAQESR